MKKIVLAYSGGLDTTTIIPWLKENYNADIVAVCVDVGQDDLEGLEERAMKSGAYKFIIENVIDEFADDYITKIIKANAVYENKYLLGTSIARPLIAKKLVEIAEKEGAYAICHGATGKGNDQVRFELGIKALAPTIEIIAPWRIWDIKSREDAINYLKEKNINIPMKVEQSYSRDENLWHTSTEGLELENPDKGAKLKKVLTKTLTPTEAPDEEVDVCIGFTRGVPTSLNGEELKLSQIIMELNKMGQANAIGIVDIVENRVVGMKSRGVYETPGGTILYYAHKEVEYLCLDKQTLGFNEIASNKFTELVYSGEWFTPLRESLSRYFDSIQEIVTGEVKLKLYKGNIYSNGATSPNSLYIEDLASFTTGDLYDHYDAEGFINLFGLSLKVRAMLNNKK